MHQERTRTVLGLLFVLSLVVVFGALFLHFRFSQSIDRERVTLVALEREIGAIDVALSDLRAAQHAYFAPEYQSQEYWTRRASELLTRLETMLAGRRDAATSPAARNHYDAAAGVLAELADLDSRARERLLNGQPTVAASLVFADSNGDVQRVRTALADAEQAETLEAQARIVESQRLSLGVDAAALVILLLVALISPRSPKPVAASSASLTAQMIRDLPPPVKTAASAAPAKVPTASLTAISLSDAAELCVDLARVIDGRDVPALVQRAADLLDAKGVILWTPEAGGALLRPSLTHGYSARVVAKLGTLDASGDNVTSLCFRSMRSQIMPGAGTDASGAIAVPLITPNGCAGVLAAEVREAKPSPELVALTRIVAAQFSALVQPNDVAHVQNAAQA